MKIRTNLNNLQNHTKYLAFKDLVRSYLLSKEYLEVAVPTLSPVIIPEGHLGIFRTEQDFFGEKEPLFLTPHPEIFLKRLLAAGSPSIFSISHAYRNHEAVTHKHSPEFEMLEFYQVEQPGSRFEKVDYMTLANDVLELLQYCCEQWCGGHSFIYQGKLVDVSQWEVITVAEAFSRYARVGEVFDTTQFFKRARELGYTTKGFSYTEVFSQIYSDKVEPNLGTNGHPTLIKDYPREMGATARWNEEKGIAERWEFYINGTELGNAANEQADHLSLQELENKYKQENEDRKKNKLTPISPDLEFPQILKILPLCSGIGIGLERLCAVILDLEDIRELKVSLVE